MVFEHGATGPPGRLLQLPRSPGTCAWPPGEEAAADAEAASGDEEADATEAAAVAAAAVEAAKARAAGAVDLLAMLE